MTRSSFLRFVCEIFDHDTPFSRCCRLLSCMMSFSFCAFTLVALSGIGFDVITDQAGPFGRF